MMIVARGRSPCGRGEDPKAESVGEPFGSDEVGPDERVASMPMSGAECGYTDAPTRAHEPS